MQALLDAIAQTPRHGGCELLDAGIATKAELQFLADLVGGKDAGDHVAVFQFRTVLVADGFHQMGGEAPLFHQHGAHQRMVGADAVLQCLVQRAAVALADFQRVAEFLGHELREHHLAEVVQQAGDEAVHRVGVVEVTGQLLGNAGRGQRVQQVLLHVETSRIALGQHADGGDAQRQVLDGVEAHEDHGVADRGDLFGQAVVGRVDDLQDLDR